MNLHKLLFPKKEKQMVDLLTAIAQMELNLPRELKERDKKIDELRYNNTPNAMENIMRASLGLPYIRFDNVEDDGKGSDRPPHYLKGLSPEARQGFVAKLAQIYRTPEFQAVANYHINDLGNHAIQIANDENMRNGRIGIIAFRKFRQEFEQADKEYVDSMKDEEKFDKHAILPEN